MVTVSQTKRGQEHGGENGASLEGLGAVGTDGMADAFPVARTTLFCMVDVITSSLSCTDPAGVVLGIGVEAYVKVPSIGHGNHGTCRNGLITVRSASREINVLLR